MSAPQGDIPPILQQFRRALDARKPHGDVVTQFSAWRQNSVKCPPNSPLHQAAEELWSRYQTEFGGNPVARGDSAAPPNKGAKSWDKRGSNRGQRKGQRFDSSGSARPPTASQPQVAGRNEGAASPDTLGHPFHNPYTFLPFSDAPLARRAPTPLTIDEEERDRFTGTVDIQLRTLSPLLTCGPRPQLKTLPKGGDHKIYDVLAIGRDVIVPATGIRGALRSLMSLIIGGTLGYVDEESWLCQGRDVRLGPTPTSPPGTPIAPFLAEVIEAGDASHGGRVRLGRTELAKLSDLVTACEAVNIALDDFRPRPGKPVRALWTNATASQFADSSSAICPWRLKLSGRPVGKKHEILERKREALFLRGGEQEEIELPAALWSAYAGRNRHGSRPELREGDLVWLEPAKPELDRIRTVNDVKSIQWARWGRAGERLLDVIEQHHPKILPDSVRSDGLVDEVTDMFGQVPRPDLAHSLRGGTNKVDGPGPAAAFAARVRPDNLVFQDGVEAVLRRVVLSPLATPHPGCAAFYRAWDGTSADLDKMANWNRQLRGYKVYRTSTEDDRTPPWRFESQGVYGRDGRIERSSEQIGNKTVDLLKGEQLGRLAISCRGLNRRELALLFAACSVDWRLGGGKPLGLGLCRVVAATALDENRVVVADMKRPSSTPADLGPLSTELSESELARLRAWQASQTPVANLRYPRAAKKNKESMSRGGHVWFGRHATPKKTADERPVGLQVLWTDGDLRQAAGNLDRIAAQALPLFDAQDPQGGHLFGFDLFSSEEGGDGATLHKQLPPFDPDKHSRPPQPRAPVDAPHAGTRETRRRDRDQR